MNGKDKCRILKEIRRKIAEENDIDLVIRECTHKGDCKGTCPRCEAEVRYLEEALEKRRQGMKRVALAGISAGVTMALSGCGIISQALRSVPSVSPATPAPEVVELDGEVPDDWWTEEPGEVPEPAGCDPDDGEMILDGEVDVFWDEDEAGAD